MGADSRPLVDAHDSMGETRQRPKRAWFSDLILFAKEDEQLLWGRRWFDQLLMDIEKNEWGAGTESLDEDGQVTDFAPDPQDPFDRPDYD